MFKSGETLKVYIKENGGITEYYNMKVVTCEDGLLELEGPKGEKTVINMRSLCFVKATIQ